MGELLGVGSSFLNLRFEIRIKW